MKRICVFCGSNLGASESYKKVAADLGRLLAKENISLVYGGANVGLMRIVAQEVLKNGGEAIGVITHFLAKKHLAQSGLSELIFVDTMQERKAKMEEMSDGFIALPGGFGTMEELFEILTAAQLGFHNKPVALINTNKFYDFLQFQLNKMVEEKMLLEPHSKIAYFTNSPADAIATMKNYKPPVVEKWIEDIVEANKKQ